MKERNKGWAGWLLLQVLFSPLYNKKNTTGEPPRQNFLRIVALSFQQQPLPSSFRAVKRRATLVVCVLTVKVSFPPLLFHLTGQQQSSFDLTLYWLLELGNRNIKVYPLAGFPLFFGWPFFPSARAHRHVWLEMNSISSSDRELTLVLHTLSAIPPLKKKRRKSCVRRKRRRRIEQYKNLNRLCSHFFFFFRTENKK